MQLGSRHQVQSALEPLANGPERVPEEETSLIDNSKNLESINSPTKMKWFNKGEQTEPKQHLMANKA